MFCGPFTTRFFMPQNIVFPSGKSVSVNHRANIYLGISFAIAGGNSKLLKISDRSEVKIKNDTRCVWNTTWKHKIKQTPKIDIVYCILDIQDEYQEYKMNIKSTRWISRIQDEYHEYKMNIKNTRWISWIQDEYQEYKMNINNTRWISRIQDEYQEYKMNIKNTRWISRIQDEYQEYKMNIKNTRWISRIHKMNTKNTRWISERNGLQTQIRALMLPLLHPWCGLIHFT